MRPAVALALLLLVGCSFTRLLNYPGFDSGEAAHVVVAGPTAYVTRGAAGVEVLDLISRTRVALVAPAAGSADHLSLAGGLLFVLDARDGRLSVYSLAAPRQPRLVDGPVTVPVGPFSGVAAAGGRVIVSGGTSNLTVYAYDESGRLGAHAEVDLGRGQPEVRIAADGRRAFVSTHFDTNDEFGLTTIDVGLPPVARGTLRLDDAGFTDGGFKPANFPLVAAAVGETIFVAHGGGLAVVDASQVAAPRLSQVLHLDVSPVSVATDGVVLAVVGSSPAPRVILLDARRLEVLRTIDLPAGAQPVDVALGEGYVVVAAGAAGALVFPR